MSIACCYYLGASNPEVISLLVVVDKIRYCIWMLMIAHKFTKLFVYGIHVRWFERSPSLDG